MTSAAEKQARYRERRRRSESVYRVAVPDRTVELMISLGWLTGEQAERRAMVEQALQDVLAEIARRWRRERLL